MACQFFSNPEDLPPRGKHKDTLQNMGTLNVSGELEGFVIQLHDTLLMLGSQN